MKTPEQYRVTTGSLATTAGDGNNGMFVVPRANGSKQTLVIIASDGGDWEHVSVSMKDRAPTWDDIAHVKRLFWEPEDAVMQLHVPESQHINNHPYCLHLWRPINKEIPLPPQFMIGIPGLVGAIELGRKNK
ncbi:TPA: DUF7694 domain-containing protein [Escherichia coli]